MTRASQKLLVGILLLANVGAPPLATAEPALDELRAFISVSPQDRLTAALAAKDLRFLGVYGYALDVPGVPEAEGPRISENGVLPIPGTSDALLSEEHADLNARARAYAKQYNTLLLAQFAQLEP